MSPGPFVWSGEVLVALVLIGFGLALWRAGEDDGAAVGGATLVDRPAGAGPAEGYGPPPPPATARRPGDAVGGVPGTAGGGPGGPGDPTSPGGTPDDAPDPAAGPAAAVARRRPSIVTRVTFGAVLVLVGAIWALRIAGLVTVGLGATLALALLVIGLGLLVGSVVGRSRWLILPGALIAPLVLLAQVVPTAALGGALAPEAGLRSAGELRVAPTSAEELAPEYRVGAGSLHLDLTGLELEDDEVVEVLAVVGLGEAVVVLPDDVGAEVRGEAGIGAVSLLGQRSVGGLAPPPVDVVHGPEDPRGRIDLEVSTGIGEVRVTTDDGGAP